MQLDTISGRMFAALASLVIVLLLAAAIFGQRAIRESHRREARSRLDFAARVFEEPASALLQQATTRDEFDRRVQALARNLGLHWTVVAPDGTVAADSDAKLPSASRADVAAIKHAAEVGREAATESALETSPPTEAVAWSVDHGGKSIGYARLVADMPELEASLHSLRTNLILGAAGALVVAFATSRYLARRLVDPLEEISRGAATVAAGGVSQKIAVRGPREIRRLEGSLNAMAVELEHRIESTRRSRAEIETILSSMAEGVVAVDEHERLLFMNHAAVKLLGISAPLAPGTVLWERLRFPDLERALRDALLHETSSQVDALSPRQDGRTIAISVAPVGEGRARGGSTMGGAVALLSDVTAIRRLEKVRIDFVANVSHELRTPLSAVLGALETLADSGQDEATQKRFLELARRNADRLHAIVSDLLDLSSIEAEGDSMALEPTPIELPMRAAANALLGAAESKGVRLELPEPAGGRVLVDGHAQRLEQVFTNLLENAIKYTPAGGKVRVRVRADAELVRVDVMDNGIGIPAASIPRVFERFYRVDRSRSREMGGTGLGLAIVKHVVRAHGGQVEVESVEGRGSTFTITLPRLADSRTPSPQLKSASQS